MSAWSRHLKKLRRSFERPSARLAARNADRDLVSGRGARWPEERPRAAMGAPGNAPAPAGRPALRERLSVRRHLPRPRGRRGAGAASCQHRGDEASSRGDLGCRCGRRACRADLRSRRLAHHAQPPRPRKHHADLASIARPGAQSGGEHLAIFTRQLALQPRLRNLRRHHRRHLRRMEQTHRPARNHHLYRDARLGSHRSEKMTFGITRFVPGLHERLRGAPNFIDARAKLIERRADAEAARAGAPVRTHTLGRHAADRIELRLLRQDSAPRFHDIGAKRFAGKKLQGRRSGLERRKRLGHCGDARHHDEAELRCALDHKGIGVRRDNELGGGFSDLIDLTGFEHRASADQNLVAKQPRNELDARQGIGRIKRHFDGAEARLDDDRRDRIRLVRRNATQNGDERGRSKHHIHRRPPSRAMRKSPRAAARSGAARAGASSASNAARERATAPPPPATGGRSREKARRASPISAPIKRPERYSPESSSARPPMSGSDRAPNRSPSKPNFPSPPAPAARWTPSANASPGFFAGAALANAPATVWSRSAANNSPVTKVLNATTRSPSTLAHFECEPGSTISRAPTSATPKISVSSPRITSG